MCTIFVAGPYHANSVRVRKPNPGGSFEDLVTFLLAGWRRVRRWIVLSKSCCVAQETVPSPASAPGFSAPTTGKIAAAESSQSQNRSDTSVSGNGAITQPGKAGGKGDPAFGGERHPLYRLTKSDTVDVNFTFYPDFNQSLTVEPDGFVALKGAGTLFVEGLTIIEVQKAVANAYRGFLHDPEVTVTLKDFDKPYFLASGEVARPGKYELRGDVTVNEAVAIAGGFTQQARHSQVVVFRRISASTA